LVRLAKEEYKKKLTSQLTDNTCLRILGATSSGPLGLVQFKISSWSFTSSSVIKKSGQVFTGKHMFIYFNYVREHNIITEHQSGFQPIDSTVNQLLHIYHTIISNLDVGKLKMFE
jgi:hypothetical protein